MKEATIKQYFFVIKFTILGMDFSQGNSSLQNTNLQKMFQFVSRETATCSAV